MNEDFLDKKLQERKDHHAFRQLRLPEGKIDLCSNDYLGIATKGLIEKALASRAGRTGHLPLTTPADAQAPPDAGVLYPGTQVPDGAGIPYPGTQVPDGADTPYPGTQARADTTIPYPGLPHGSGGSRLLAGNYPLIESTERALAAFHEAETGLIFNSGYDANLGLLSCIAQKGDTILYDHLSHASIRDGIRLSFSRAFSFKHNDLADLEKKLQQGEGTLFVVTESVFSMDGDQAPLVEMSALCHRYGAHLIVDEAHATGVVGGRGEGLVQALRLQKACFARVHTFGKAVGCHGAIILGSHRLRDYLINFCRPLIYTTALPASALAAIHTAYELFPDMQEQRRHLQALIARFREADMGFVRLDSMTPIQGVVVPGNDEVRTLAARLQGQGLDIRPILYPTVPMGSERLRIVLHAFNTIDEVDRLIGLLNEV